MDAHHFIGVPLRVTDDALRERLQDDLTRRWEGVLDCHRNQEFLDLVPAGATKARDCAPSWTGPWQDRTSRSGPSATPGTTWTCTPSPTTPSPCPRSPPEVTAACETTVGSMAELITTILEGDRHE